MTTKPIRLRALATLPLLLVISCVTPEEAKSSARQFATDLGYEVKGVACAGRDGGEDEADGGAGAPSRRQVGTGAALE